MLAHVDFVLVCPLSLKIEDFCSHKKKVTQFGCIEVHDRDPSIDFNASGAILSNEQ